MEEVNPYWFVKKSRQTLGLQVFKQALARLRDPAVESRESEVSSLAEWLTFTPVTITGWLDGASPILGGFQTPLQEGWLRRNDPSSKPPVATFNLLQEALWHAIGDRVIMPEVLAKYLEVNEQNLLCWLYGESQTSLLTRMTIEYQLNLVGYWPNPSYTRLRDPLRGLAEILVAHLIEVDECLVKLNVSDNRMFRWLRVNSNLSQVVTDQIITLISEVRSKSNPAESAPQPVNRPAVKPPVKTTATPAVAVPSEKPIPIAPVIVLANVPDTLANLLTHVGAYAEYLLRHGTTAERDAFRERHAELTFTVGNNLAALGSEEAYRAWQQRTIRRER